MAALAGGVAALAGKGGRPFAAGSATATPPENIESCNSSLTIFVPLGTSK